MIPAFIFFMEISTYIPEQPFWELSTDEFVSCSTSTTGVLRQYYSFQMSPDRGQTLLAVPDGVVDIIFRCCGTNPHAQVYGSVLKGKQITFVEGAQYFGVRFLPGAAEPVLGCPLDQFTDHNVLLDDVQGGTNELVDLISSADSFQERVMRFEEYHNVRAKKNKPVPPLVHDMLSKINASFGDIRIQTLADETGYSSRHLNNVFKKHVGVSPKFYERVVRFQRCLDQLQRHHPADLTELAYDAGYYDQAHFINEFKEFSLKTPTQVLCS